ncbi:MAG: envelope stress response membrane protein PspC [Rhodospirillales bacterium]|nr:envelope stress response membrane protein PspC [Rhodospirillales bacterium]
MNDNWDRWRIWRDPKNGWIAGVCAGIADYLGVSVGLVRLVVVLGLIFLDIPTLVAYVALAFVLKPKPPKLYADPAEEAFWRGLRADPRATLESVRARLRALEGRLIRAESLVASEEFDLRRRFRDLGA